MPKFQKGEWVLITGGSSGIGEEFAYQLAKMDVNLILVGRNVQRLESVKRKIENVNKNIRVEALSFDLSNDMEGLIKKLDNYPIDHLINNAGFGWYGEFVNGNKDIYENMISVNIKSLTILSYHFSKKFIEKEKGGIINVASVAGFFPIPHFAVYGATKAYVYSLSYALWAELKRHNVHVMCLSPGKTKTRFFERANMESSDKTMSAKKVVEGALKAYSKNKPLYIPGFSNKLSYLLVRKIFSDKFISKLLEKNF